MDVTQAAGAGGFLDPKVKIKEEDLVDPEASEIKEGAALPKLMGRSWEDVGLKVKQEPEEEPSGNWDARLQAFLKTLHAPHSARGTPQRPEQKQGNDPKMPPVPSQGLTDPNKWPKGLWVSSNQPHLVGKAEQDEETQLDAPTHREKEKEGILAEDPLGAEIQCRRFRTVCYEDADGPRELCGQLLELCRQWLKPERHTKEQMVELVTLEQFLAILPLDMQSWLRQNDPVTCAEAVTLAEDFLLSRQEARDWGRQVLGMPEEEPSQNLPEVKIQLFEETKQEEDENVTLLTGGGWLRESEEEQPLVESPEETGQLTVLKTDKEDDSLFQGEPDENKPGLKGQNGQDEEGGEDLLAHDARKEDGETTVQLDENMEYNERGEIFGQSLQLSGQESTPEEVKSYKCWHCGQSFSSSSDLLIHERNHVGEQLYKCSHCGGSERIHMGRKPRKCSHCGNTFGCNPQQETNGETKLHTCSECGEKYIHISGLLRHQKTHRGEKAYKCLKCGENFGTYSGLRAHWRTHTGENQYKCLQCEMCFSGITRLRAHEKVHMAVCSSCGKTFSQKSELIEHERTHARENSFLCLDCGKAFEFHSELVAHVRTHRDKKLECPDSKNTLICSECGDTFRHSSALKAHQRVHRGEHKREQQDPEESAERPKEIKREPEEEASQAEEPRKKQKLMMETRRVRSESPDPEHGPQEPDGTPSLSPPSSAGPNPPMTSKEQEEYAAALIYVMGTDFINRHGEAGRFIYSLRKKRVGGSQTWIPGWIHYKCKKMILFHCAESPKKPKSKLKCFHLGNITRRLAIHQRECAPMELCPCLANFQQIHVRRIVHDWAHQYEHESQSESPGSPPGTSQQPEEQQPQGQDEEE